jgi:hypothetical protein
LEAPAGLWLLLGFEAPAGPCIFPSLRLLLGFGSCWALRLLLVFAVLRLPPTTCCCPNDTGCSIAMRWRFLPRTASS